jgi:Fe-S-cluster containining protein
MPEANSSPTLHLPQGINYECDGCGKCCSGWAVPMTEEDYKRISPIDWGELLPKVKGRRLFRPLRPHEKKDTPYSNAIVEYDDGFCPFLVNNLCFIHGQRGSKFKPAMCQQFPYSFNETPSGIYATVSFVSYAVCHNNGKSLIEQREYMEGKLADFQKLYPNAHPNWSKLEITTGKPITWEQYLGLEKEIIAHLQERDKPLEQRFLEASRFLAKRAAGTASAGQNGSASTGTTAATSAKAAESAAAAPTSNATNGATGNAAAGPKGLKAMDNHLLYALHSTYFPTKILSPSENQFQVSRILGQILLRGFGAPLKISVPGQSYSLAELQDIEWPNDEPELEDLIYRYFFSRVFGKLYFAAGYGQLSVLAGFNHLAHVFALLKLQSKALAKSRGAKRVNYLDLVTTVRQLEKRLGEASLSGYAAAMFELLMFSPQRLERVLAAAS